MDLTEKSTTHSYGQLGVDKSALLRGSSAQQRPQRQGGLATIRQPMRGTLREGKETRKAFQDVTFYNSFSKYKLTSIYIRKIWNL